MSDDSTDSASPHCFLVVDDDRVLRERLARALSDRGFTAHTAEDFDGGLAVAKREPITHAVVDYKMPGPSGLELVKALHELRPGMSIVVLTGYGTIGTAIDAIRLGATYFVNKPANTDEILSAFERGESPPMEGPETDSPETPSLARAEWEHIQRVMADTGGNVSEAARRLGLHRRSLQRKLQKLPPRE